MFEQNKAIFCAIPKSWSTLATSILPTNILPLILSTTRPLLGSTTSMREEWLPSMVPAP